MYCINCRYYDDNIHYCLNRDGLKGYISHTCFCSYIESTKNYDISCINCKFYKNEMNNTGFCDNKAGGLQRAVFSSDYCCNFILRDDIFNNNNLIKPKVGWLYKNEDKGYIILEKINERGLCEVYNYDENGEKLTYTLGINSLGEPIMQVFKEK